MKQKKLLWSHRNSRKSQILSTKVDGIRRGTFRDFCEYLCDLNLAAEAVAKGEAFFVEGFELVDIAADAVDLHRTLGTDADDLAPVFHALDEVELFVVDLHVMAQDNTQTGILLVE